MRCSVRAFLLAPLALCLLVRPAPAQDDEARSLITSAIRALGGDAKLAKLRALHTKWEGHAFRGATRVALKAEGAVQLPNKYRMQMELALDNNKVTVLDLIDGDKGMRSYNGGDPEPLKKEMLPSVRRALRNFAVEGALPDLLTDKAYTLSPLGELKVNDRPALGVKVSRKGRADVDLYFDKTDRLLVKAEWKGASLDLQQEVAWEVVFSNYKETDGVKRPRTLLLNVDGQKYMEVEVTEVRFAERIDDTQFTRP
jgi:hypothetical protein